MARDAIGDRGETTLENRTSFGRPPCEKGLNIKTTLIGQCKTACQKGSTIIVCIRTLEN